LERRCAFLSAALGSVTDCVYALDRSRRFVYARETIHIGKQLADLGLEPELHAKLERCVDNIFATGEHLRDEVLYVTPGGTPELYQLMWRPLFDAGGAVELVVCVARLATGRRALEERLAGTEARLRAITELSPTLLWETGVNGDGFTANAQWVKYVGRSATGAEKVELLDAIHPADLPASAAAFRKAFQNGSPLELQYRIRASDGTYRWFMVRHVPIVNDNGAIVRWLGAATDVHDQHRALDAVEHQVESRTRERDSLRRRLLAADEAQRRSLARELHDQLGQQMTGLSIGLDRVQSLTELSDYPGAAALHERVGELRDLTAEMIKAVRYVTLELRAPELDDMGVQSAIQTYVREWGRRYDVETHFDGPDPAVVVSPEASSTLYRIVQEALTNVIKHANAHRIDVALKRCDDGVMLAVRDDGAGFDVEAVRARSKVTRRLGLASIQERVFLSSGTFTIRSHPGDGSGLEVTIPDQEFSKDE
jgi:two-component system, NarL family, sensor histidine kinase UhpB